MQRVVIRNSFYHVMLFVYFKHADIIYKSAMGLELNNFNHSDKSSQLNIFKSINFKLKNRINSEPSFLNDLYMVLGVKQVYPLYLDLNFDEKFWFEFIINLDLNKIKYNIENYNKQRALVRFNGEIDDSFFKEIEQRLYTTKACEYLRKKFVFSEKIDNTALKQGLKINPGY